MNFTFRPAVREQTNLIIGLAGPSSSGKTLSALRIARGLVGGDDTKIFMIDTEQGRALHYACAPNEQTGPFKFKFQYLKLTPPFSPAAYASAIEAAAKAGAGVVIVDSMSHEHEGQGGILEMHEANLKKMAGDDWAKRERVKFTAWIEPKQQHNRFVNTMLQQPCHILLCFRAKDKLALIKNDKGKIEPVKVGWTAICSDRLEYEATMLLMLPPNSKGVPDLNAEQTKLQEQHRGFVQPGKSITEDLGKQLAAWAAGGIVAETPKQPEQPPVDQKSNGHDAPARTDFVLNLPMQWPAPTADRASWIKAASLAAKEIDALPDAIHAERWEEINTEGYSQLMRNYNDVYQRLGEKLAAKKGSEA